MEKFLKKDLVLLCKDRKLKISGNKQDLIDRLKVHSDVCISASPSRPSPQFPLFDILTNMYNDILFYTLDFVNIESLLSLLFVNKRYKSMVVSYLERKYPIDREYAVRYAFNQNKYITQSKAVGYYRIPRKILDEIEAKLVNNPYYKSAPEMKLYKLSDIVPLVLKKFGSISALVKYNEKLKARPKKVSIRERRAEFLRIELSKRGVCMREDSRLCQGYISGQLKCDENDIVQRMCEMKYLHECMDYNKFLQRAREEHVYLDMSIPDTAEWFALQTLPENKYPSVFPWEK
jgi:hypothetical protein